MLGKMSVGVLHPRHHAENDDQHRHDDERIGATEGDADDCKHEWVRARGDRQSAREEARGAVGSTGAPSRLRGRDTVGRRRETLNKILTSLANPRFRGGDDAPRRGYERAVSRPSDALSAPRNSKRAPGLLSSTVRLNP